MGLTAVSGSAAGGIAISHFFNLEFSNAAALGLSVTWGAWTYLIIQENWPRTRYKPAAMSAAPTGESVLYNGRRLFLSSISWLGQKRTQPNRQQSFIFYVPHPDLEQPKQISEARLHKYIMFGWRRQITGERYPFSQRAYKSDNWDTRLVACCYALLAGCGCFDTFGPGKRSRLVVSPQRVLPIAKRRYAHAVNTWERLGTV